MKRIFIIFLLCATSTVAQSLPKRVMTNKKETKAHTIFSKSGVSGENSGAERPENFRSPFRYIIFSNLTEKDLELEIPQRRLEILMDKKAFNEKNLRLLFSLLKNRFPSPVRLDISVHTSLQTIETPEEEETISDHTSREGQLQYHKTALYIRFDDGSEGFQYDYGKPPGFWRKFVDLPNSKQIPKNKSISRN